jgi:hypothetical protein
MGLWSSLGALESRYEAFMQVAYVSIGCNADLYT